MIFDITCDIRRLILTKFPFDISSECVHISHKASLSTINTQSAYSKPIWVFKTVLYSSVIIVDNFGDRKTENSRGVFFP